MTTREAEPRVLIIVPTLGQRIDYLHQTLRSVRDQSVATDLVLVAPPTESIQELAAEFDAKTEADPGSLPAAINAGARHLKPHHEFINWIGDDDLLEPQSLAATSSSLDRNPAAVVAYGACRYIDAAGRELWINRAGPWAEKVLSWGPQLIPQPGMLIRADAWRAVHGVDESFRFAFDFDLLLKLRQQGELIDCGQVVASFRWHPDSLTVGDRTTNLQESERAKRRYLTRRQQRLKWLWERPVRVATRIAAAEVTRRARKLST